LTRDQLIDFARGSSAFAYDRSIAFQGEAVSLQARCRPKNPNAYPHVRHGGLPICSAVSRGEVTQPGLFITSRAGFAVTDVLAVAVTLALVGCSGHSAARGRMKRIGSLGLLNEASDIVR